MAGFWLSSYVRQPPQAVEAKKDGKRPKAPGKKATKGIRSTRRCAKKIKAAKGGSKRDEMIAMISRKGGATLAELMKAFKCQKHSVRGASAS